MKIKFGQLHATTLCQYTAFAEVANAALGGGEAKEKREDLTAGAANGDQALAMINAALKFG